MGFFKRLFSSDYRAAVAAEAAGDLDVAAERYALAGERDAAVRVHLARAERATAHADTVIALRDALHWAVQPEQRRLVKRRLGLSILERARAEGIATERDRDRVREASKLLVDAGHYEDAGDALEEIGDDVGAAEVFEHGGLVERMELAMLREEERTNAARRLDNAFEEYELHERGGDRARAREALVVCVEVADTKTEYRRLLDELDSRTIALGAVRLRRRDGTVGVLCAGPRVRLGRDALCELMLRSGGVSRMHAEVERTAGGFVLRDAQSRNGTLLAGMPISGEVPLVGEGTFELGEHCGIAFRVDPRTNALLLRVTRGLDRGLAALLGPEARSSLDASVVLDVPATVHFRDGRPWLQAARAGESIRLNDEPIAFGAVQLVHGDQLHVGGVDLEVP